MKDRDFLIWIHERLHHQYKEDECVDYMHKLRAIIRNTNKNKITPNANSCNSMHSLMKELD